MKKISESTAARIVDLYGEGKSSYKISAILGITPGTACKYARRAGISRTISVASTLARLRDTKINVGFFREWSPNLAYLLGIIWTDGCLGKPTRGEQVTLSMKEPELLGKIGESTGAKVSQHRNRKEWIWTIRFSLSTVVSWFKERGLTGRKSFTVEWPKDLPVDMEIPFVRGLIDGDGSFFIGKRDAALGFGFVSASEVFAKQVKEWIGVRVAGGGISCEKGKYWRIRYYGQGAEKIQKMLAPKDGEWGLDRKWKMSCGSCR
jgi:hypothetical protein